MVIGKLFTKLVQAIPSWEMTKYYGRVCVFQLQCIKYKIQTSEAWFNFRCKFMPNSIQAEESKAQKTDSCESNTDKKQVATEIQSKSKIWLPKKLSQSGESAKSNENKKWIPFKRGSKDKKS